MKSLFLLPVYLIVCLLLCTSTGFAQNDQSKEKEVIITKSKKSDDEKNVWVNVSVNNGVKHTKVTVEDKNGNEKVYEWDGDEMPEDIQEELGDLEIQVIELDKGETEMILDVDKEEKDGQKQIKIKIKGQDGKDKVIEWEGEGDIPDHILEKMEGQGENIFIFDQNQHQVISGKAGEQIKIKLKNKDGEEIEWIGEGEIPEDILKKIGDPKHIEHIDVQKVRSENKAFLGVYAGYKVESTIENGNEETKEEVEVMKVVEGSGAEMAGLQKGDLLLSIAGQKISSAKDLSEAIAPFEPGDIVEIKFIRDGKEEAVKATLGAPQAVDIDNQREVIIIKEIEKSHEGHEDAQIDSDHEGINLKKTLSLNDIQIYPNPSDGLIRLKFDGAAGATTLRLTTIRGKKLYEEKLDDFKGSFDKEISIKRYPKGAILLSIEQNGGIYQEQIIHQ